MKSRLAKKSLILLFLTFILSNMVAINLLSTTSFAPDSTLANIYVDPASIIDSSLTAGSSFTVDLRISDADYELGSDVYSYQICMLWDTVVVDIDDAIAWGDFMSAPRVGYWGAVTEDAAAGQPNVTVTDGSVFEAGVTVLIEDDSNSEENEVDEVLGNKLIMKNDLAHTYTIAANGGAYPIPGLTPLANINHAAGRAILGQSTTGPAPGAQGDGLLCTLTFSVLADGETDLDIDEETFGAYTFIVNRLGETLGDDPSEAGDPGYWQHELLKGSGYFSNTAAEVGWIEGTVTDSDTAAVIEGATVSTDGYSATTDASGFYSLEVSPGTYDVTAEMAGYETQTATGVVVAADATVTEDFALVPFVGPVLYVDPADTTASPGESFTISISIEDVVDLFSYEAKIGFDNTVLEPVSVDEGPFIMDQTTSPSGTYFAPIIEDDYVYAACVTLGMYPGVSGSGVLFTVTFNVIAYGESVLDLYDTILIDSTNTQMSHNLVDGYFSTPPPPQYELTIAVDGSGTTDPVPGTYMYDEGTEVTVTAVADVAGWVFDYWMLDGDGDDTDNPYTLIMLANHTLTAVFVEGVAPQYELVIAVDGSGTTDPVPGTYMYDEGTEVTVLAVADVAGWLFDHWLLDGGGEDPDISYTLIMLANHTLTAVFVEEVVPEVEIESCDSTGTAKDGFDLDEEVWVIGSGFESMTLVDIYVVEDVTTWSYGMDITALTIMTVKNDVATDGDGKIAATPLWTSGLVPGDYDIVADANQNGVYDEGDALDDMDVNTAGFFVIPELLFGTILGLIACFAAFGAFYLSKHKHQPNTRLR